MIAATTDLVVDITPARGIGRLNVRELWAYRELLYFFVWRDIKVRYKQTALGAAWAIIQPLMTMVVFAIFFGRLARVPSDGLPYPVFSFAALVPWTYFATALSSGSMSLGAYQHVISKVYFPRLLIPLATVIAPLVDFAISFVILLALMFWYGIVPGRAIVWLPVMLGLAVATASSVSLWLSALSAQYRDVRYVVPFAMQLWMFATPVAYPASLVPVGWRTLYGLNPMTGVIEGFRWALLGGPAPGRMVWLSAAIVLLSLVGAVHFFRAAERTFADVI